jgi:hypothetical protein
VSRRCAHRRIRAVVAQVFDRPMICVAICCACAATQLSDGRAWRDGGSLDANLAAPDGYPEGSAMVLIGGAESTPARRRYVYADVASGARTVSDWYARHAVAEVA